MPRSKEPTDLSGFWLNITSFVCNWQYSVKAKGRGEKNRWGRKIKKAAKLGRGWE